MFSFESEEVRNIVVELVSRYESHFKIDFPLPEYLSTKNGIVTKTNAEQLETLINDSIKTKKPVATPKNFTQRLY